MMRPLVFVLMLALSATGAWADRHSDCKQDKDPDRRISGCTQIIERGKRESQETRAAAYNNRGSAYDDKGDYDRAIADYDKAITLNPKLANAYNNRGAAYEEKGDKEQAIADFRKALEIDQSHQYAKKGLKRLGVTP